MDIDAVAVAVAADTAVFSMEYIYIDIFCMCAFKEYYFSSDGEYIVVVCCCFFLCVPVCSILSFSLTLFFSHSCGGRYYSYNSRT